MVHVYNCHPFASQQIVQVEQEPGLVCCGGGALFVVASGGCKVEAYNLDQEGCPLICRFATMGTVKSIHHSNIGDYLVTIEEKNNATYLRAYTNWRCQAEEKARVGVRLLGHLLRGASVRGGTQMEIIEIPMSVRPLAVACCTLTGDLVVGCAGTLVLFTLRRQNQLSLSQQNIQPLWQSSQQNPSLSQGQNSSPNPNISVLDFERSVILHLPGLIPHQVSLCGAFVAVQAELEVLVLRLDGTPDPKNKEESPEKYQRDYVEDPPDFLLLPRHQELLGERARESGLLVTMEKTGLEDKGQQYTLSYVLYRRFAPDFFLGCSVEETRLHSLQLHPLFTSKQSVCDEEPACVFCFFSLPTTGYLYSLRGGVELLSTYQYPEKALEAVLTNQFLHVITKNALQCFSVRCAAVAARVEDPYIDTTMRACPPCSLEVCALRMQLFIGLRSVCVYGRHVILFSAADAETPEEAERSTQRRSIELKEHTMLTGIFLAVGIDPSTTPALESLLSRPFSPFLSKKWASTRPRESSSSVGLGWNLYVIHTVSPIELYHEMLEYSRRYAETNPQPQSCCHLLSEAHLLLRAALLSPPPGAGSVGAGSVKPSLSPPPGGSVKPSDSPNNSDCTHAEKDTDTQVDGHVDRETERKELEDAFKENCAQLGDCFSRSGQRDCHLALPYYRMSDLSITDVIARNRPLPSSPCSYGPGFLFYLKHFLLEDADQILSQEAADEVIDVFSQSEPSQLVSVCASPGMANTSPATAMVRLQHVEDTAGVSVPLTLTMATMALRLGNLPQYTQLITRHAEMLLVYGFIEEPRLLLHWGHQGDTQTMMPTALTTTHLTHTQMMMQSTAFTTHLTHTEMMMQPTALTTHLTHTQPGLLVAAMVALHENNKVQLDQADRIFKDLGCEDGLLVDFWEAVLMASSQDTIIHELLFRLASVYIERLIQTQPDARSSLPPVCKSLKTAEDLINSCSHYGILYPWLSVLTPALTTTSQQQEALHKLQSLLCGPSLSVGSVVPLVDRVSEADTLWGLSLHVLCATRRGQYETSMEKLLDRCPQAIIPYANHQLQDTHMALWWQKLLPELCERTRAASDNAILLAALKETLVVVAMETTPAEFLELLPDDGTALYFLPHLLACSQKHLLA